MNKQVQASSVESRIYRMRGKQVMLSMDLAVLYGVEVKVLMQSVKRNLERFPNDFMFQLSVYEWQNLKSQIVTSSWGGIRRANNSLSFIASGVSRWRRRGGRRGARVRSW